MDNQDLKQGSWDHARHALQCHLCAPREPDNEHRLFIAQLTVSTLYLFRDQRFRGYALLTFDSRHATALEELDSAEYDSFMQDLRQAATAIRTALNPDHMNYECLGNTSPHLHWHIVPRYRNDPRWGQPIWEGWQRDEFTLNRLGLTETEYSEIIEQIRRQLATLKT